jgi:pimeloyl-ACP methyl ester carboxylesterase
VAPVARTGWILVRAGTFLVEFVSDAAWKPLSSLTTRPLRRRMPAPSAVIDRWMPTGLSAGVPLVLVHGFAPRGKNDRRVRMAAMLLARAGFDVLVPTIPGLTAGRLRPDDAEPVVAALAARPEPAIVLAVSVGTGPAFLAAADPRVRDRVRTLVSLGGYASALELLRFFVTGDYAFGDLRGHVGHDPEVVRSFVRANADLVDDSARRLLAARDTAEAEAAAGALSPTLRELLDTLSPLRVARDIPARLILVHGRGDPAVPYTESLRLAAARPERTRVVLVGLLGHVEGSVPPSRTAMAIDALRLWGVLYGLLADG